MKRLSRAQTVCLLIVVIVLIVVAALLIATGPADDPDALTAEKYQAYRQAGGEVYAILPAEKEAKAGP